MEEAYRNLQKDHGLTVARADTLEQELERLQEELDITRSTVKILEIVRSEQQDELARTRVERDEVTEHLTKVLAENAELTEQVQLLTIENEEMHETLYQIKSARPSRTTKKEQANDRPA
jgi:chromosome segregation ATPase